MFGLVIGRMINSRNCPGTCAVERKEMCLMVHVKETSRRWLYSGNPVFRICGAVRPTGEEAKS
jgi:hypothetical protein